MQQNKIKSSTLPYIYFLSTGRAGTNFLYKVFEEIHPDLKITHQSNWSRLINIIGNILLIESAPLYLIEKVFKYLKNEEIPNSTIDPLLSVSICHYLKSTDQINDPKIIHIVRDPRDFVTSFINWKNQRLRRFFLHHFMPFWQPSVLFSKKIPFIRKMMMNKFEYFSWAWAFKNNYFRKVFEKSENYYLVKFEDLIDETDGIDNIKKMFDFLDLTEFSKDLIFSNNKKLNQSQKKNFPGWKHWESQKAIKLNRYCGDLMTTYGYGMEESWKLKLKER